jgi:glutathione S-transferase
MKLYYTPGACSLSPHIVLREAGLPHDLEKVDLKTRKTETGADFVAVNDKGYVPVLQLDDGQRLTEGPAIVQYLADLRPSAKLLPPAGSIERARVQEWLNFITTELHKGFAPFFSADTPDDYKPVARQKLEGRIGYLDRQFADGRSYLTGASFTVADAYLFVVLGWGKHIGLDIARWPNVAAYAARVAQRPKVQEALRAEGLLAA